MANKVKRLQRQHNFTKGDKVRVTDRGLLTAPFAKVIRADPHGVEIELFGATGVNAKVNGATYGFGETADMDYTDEGYFVSGDVLSHRYDMDDPDSDEQSGQLVKHSDKGHMDVTDDAIVIVGMSDKLPDAIELLDKYDRESEMEVDIEEKVDAFFLDGAINFQRAITDLHGKSFGKTEQQMFGSSPPKMVSVETAPGVMEQVLWGSVTIPGVEGILKTVITTQHGWPMFGIEGTVKKKHEKTVKELADYTRALVKHNSIYKGKALDIRFPNMDEETNPFEYAPKFLQPDVKDDELIFNGDIEDTIRCFIYSFIEHTTEVEKMGEQVKRGVLIAGDPGVGKTMLSSVLARKCIENGWTFLYVKDITELPQAVEFARDRFEPAVVFAEDLDRLVGVERTDAANTVLNTVDGINTKGNRIMLVVTTNHLEEINEVMLRPGRLDVIVPILPPNAEAVEKLIRRKAGSLLAETEDITSVCDTMAGTMPAVITELVKRAKLVAFDRVGKSAPITQRDLTAAANTLESHAKRLMKKRELDKRSEREKAASIIAHAMKGEDVDVSN